MTASRRSPRNALRSARRELAAGGVEHVGLDGRSGGQQALEDQGLDFDEVLHRSSCPHAFAVR
jgi:hypothetical protein